METPTHTAQWTFDAAIRDTTTARAYGALALEKLTEGASNDTIVREFKYDVRARQSRVITLQRAKEFWQDTTYDRFSRPFQSFFEARTDAMRRTGEYFEYSNHGYQVATRDAYGSTSGREYHRVLAMDARGQVLREQRGANPALETARTYDLNTGWLNVINSANRSIQDLRYDYDVLGNVRQRRDLTTPSGAPARNVVETLSYDKLQRLRTNAIAVNGTVGETRTTIYDGAANAQGPGNISQKDGRDYVYATRPAVCGAGAAPGPHAVSQITGSGITDYACYDAAGNQTHVYRQGIVQALREITYTTFNLPDSIKASQYSTDTRFGYGPNRERVWRGELNIYGAAYEETLFIGNAEVVIAGNTVTLRRYVAGSIVEQRKLANGLQTSRVRYLFNDALGSTSAVVEDTGAIANNGAMGFDPWGARRVLSTGSVLGAAERAGFPASETTRKGFTGHEQVDGADVIHMNGRIYDPLTARFLQADPMVQDPYNGQSFNRYTYVFNNPLIYTDPTGYWGRREQAYLRSIVAIGITIWFPGFATQAFGLTGFQTTVLTGFLAGSVQTGTLKGGLQGAFSAALFHGVGTKFGGAHWSIRAAAHGVAGGIMAEVQGGRFGHGFASAGSAELLAPVVQHAEGTGPGEAIARMIVGGTASVASGGKFANGAVTSAFAYAFNDAMHRKSAREAARDQGEELLGPYVSGYDPNDPNYHRYEIGPTELCTVGDRGCSFDMTASITASKSVPFVPWYSGPGAYDLPDTEFPWVVGNPINHRTPERGVWVNDTSPGHRYHPGSVAHGLYQSRGRMWLYTIGAGTGPNPAENISNGNWIFGGMHGAVRHQVARAQIFGPGY
jgi:RHS repeat-associated protein